ncbi:NAD(P)-binding protein [Pholiota conissans]|uniref:NAD(P)-binding protein n=1 Tax=Pholiota conissans TaxID=109636 RepID=A0A9P5ZDF2_9AGAR|nr:NAD(P)-binding protein [Pholiota conissans]
MSHITDDQLLAHSDRVQGKVVVITGGANGFGKETALLFAAYGANIVIGDLDVTGAAKVVAEIKKIGGSAAWIKCNVTKFEEQVELFELAVKKFGSVDIVIPNAGVSELGTFRTVAFNKDGKPVKPSMATLEINLYGVLYTAHLATHYLRLNQKENDLKSIVFIGSVASWMAIPMGELYSGSKHAVLGIMRSLHPIMETKGIRVVCIHPFFADTAIVPTSVKLVLAGIPLTPVFRVARAIFHGASDVDMKTSGSSYLLLDNGPVFMVPKDEFKEGVYKMIDNRANAATAVLIGVKAWAFFFRDVWRITGPFILRVIVTVVLAKIAWANREWIERSVSDKIYRIAN